MSASWDLRESSSDSSEAIFCSAADSGTDISSSALYAASVSRLLGSGATWTVGPSLVKETSLSHTSTQSESVPDSREWSPAALRLKLEERSNLRDTLVLLLEIKVIRKK